MSLKGDAGRLWKQVAVAMKLVFVALVLFVAAPAAAWGEATLTMRDVPLHGERTLASAPPPRFEMVGLHWRGPGSVEFRTRSLSGRWSAWHRAAPEAEDLPDPASGENAATRGWRLGNPYWVGASDRIAYRLHGKVTRPRAYFLQSPQERIPFRRVAVAGEANAKNAPRRKSPRKMALFNS